MVESKKDPIHTLADEDIVSTTLTRRSLLAQTGLVLGLAGVAAIGAVPAPARAQPANDADDNDPKPKVPDESDGDLADGGSDDDSSVA